MQYHACVEKWKEIIKSVEIIEKKTREKFKIHLKEISQLLLIENFTKILGILEVTETCLQ